MQGRLRFQNYMRQLEITFIAIYNFVEIDGMNRTQATYTHYILRATLKSNKFLD